MRLVSLSWTMLVGVCIAEKVPFVYHNRYNISLFGLEKLHFFDAHKYGKIAERLKQRFGFTSEQFHKPSLAAPEYLSTFHDRSYVNGLHQGGKEVAVRAFLTCVCLAALNVCNPIACALLGMCSMFAPNPYQARLYGVGLLDDLGKWISPLLMLFPAPMLEYCVLQPMKYGVAGTALALEKAMDSSGCGWCVNLSGGYHHARRSGGGGFCYFNDTALALLSQIKKNPDFKALIIDCDFHCGDGNADFVRYCNEQLPGKNNVTIIDLYAGNDYPFDEFPARSTTCEQSIQFPNPIINRGESYAVAQRPKPVNKPAIKGVENTNWYLDVLKENLQKVGAQSFDCIIFNAGTDTYEHDGLTNGWMGLTKEQIKQRDEIVFQWATDRQIPLVYVLSGGYNKHDGALLVADSLINIYEKFGQKN